MDKHCIFHNHVTLKQSSLRLILSFAALTGFTIWTQDVDQAYIQSDGPLRRAIYLLPPEILQSTRGTICKLLEPLHGVFNAGYYWYSFGKHLIDDLELTTITTEKALCTKVCDM